MSVTGYLQAPADLPNWKEPTVSTVRKLDVSQRLRRK